MSVSVQYLRHLHEKIRTLSDRTAPPSEDQVHADAAASAAAGLIGGYGLGNDMLMITNGGFGGKNKNNLMFRCININGFGFQVVILTLPSQAPSQIHTLNLSMVTVCHNMEARPAMDRPAMELQEGFIDRSIDSNDSQNSGLVSNF